jgi:hypothetical protein
MLKVVMAPLQELQKSSGLAFEMPYRGSMFSVSLKIPLLFICGDAQGQDILVGRRKVYHNLTGNQHICRYCNVPYDQTDNPLFKASLTKASRIALFIANKQREKLIEIGYNSIDDNALHGLCFCDDEYGLNGSLPADLLHTYQLGILIYIVEAFFSLKRPNKETIRSKQMEQKNHEFRESKKRKFSKNDSIARLDDDSLSLSIMERSNYNVFNESEQEIFDCRAKQIGKALSQQSDRDLPRTHFPSGITTEKKKNGHEMQGVVLNILFVVLSDIPKYSSLMGDTEYEGRRLSNWILLLERVLLVEEFLKTNKMKRSHIEKFAIYFPYFLKYLKKVVDRQEGSGFKLLKYHLCTHFASDIKKWGPPCCYNSSTGESNHKFLKIRSRKTQRQVDLIEEQTAVRYVEQLAIRRTLDNMKFEEKIYIGKAYGQISRSKLQLNGLSYRQTKNGICCVDNGLVSEFANWKSRDLQNTLSSLLSQVIPHVKCGNIPFYTTLNDGENQIYRADPCYKGNVWQDWAYCNWEDEGIIPVHILIFVDLMGLTKANVRVSNISIPGPDQYAIVHMIQYPLESIVRQRNKQPLDFKAHPRSILFHKASKIIDRITNEPEIAFVPISCIHSPCIAIPLKFAKKNEPHSYLFLQSKTKWNSLFVNSMRCSLKNKNIVKIF